MRSTDLEWMDGWMDGWAHLEKKKEKGKKVKSLSRGKEEEVDMFVVVAVGTALERKKGP